MTDVHSRNSCGHLLVLLLYLLSLLPFLLRHRELMVNRHHRYQQLVPPSVLVLHMHQLLFLVLVVEEECRFRRQLLVQLRVVL